MSYDLHIWSRQRVETDQKGFNICEYTVTIEKSIMVENEDIPTNVMLSLAEIKYLTSIHLQPSTNEKAITDKAIRYAKKLAKEYHGVVENPQLDNKVLLTKKRKHLRRQRGMLIPFQFVGIWIAVKVYPTKYLLSSICLKSTFLTHCRDVMAPMSPRSLNTQKQEKTI